MQNHVNSVLNIHIINNNVMKAKTYKEFVKEAEEVNEARVVSFDDAFNEITSDEYEFEINYRSHGDIQEFIDFLRTNYPRGTRFV